MGLNSLFNNLRIRYKLFASYSVAFLITVSLGSLIIYSIFQQTIETRIEGELSNTTSAVLNMVETTFRVSIKNHLRTIAEKNTEIASYFYSMYKSGQLSEKDAMGFAGNTMLSQTIGSTGYIYCLNSDGVIMVHPEKDLIGEDLSGYDFIKQQKEQKKFYIEYDWKNPGEKRTRPKALYMSYFSPWDWIISASSYRNEFQHLVHINEFEKSIRSLRFSRKGFAAVFDKSGKMVIQPKVNEMFFDPENKEYQSFILDMLETKKGKQIFSYKATGRSSGKVMVIYSEIPNFNLTVACFIDLEDAFAPLKTVRNVMAATVLLSLFLFLPVTLLINASITRPLYSLTKHLDDENPGRFLPINVPPSKDEVGRLIKYFNMFMERLEISGKELAAEMEERKKAENAIRESEKKYRDLVQNANSIILQVDKDGRISFMNTYALNFFDYEEKDIIGCSLQGTIVSEDVNSGRNFISFITSGDEEPNEDQDSVFENIRRNGDRVWISWTRRGIHDKDGNTKEYLCIGNDLTERVKMQEMMVHTEKMVSIGGLAAGMAHEINNPLGVMVQNTQNIVRRLSLELEKNRQVADESEVDLDGVLRYVRARSIDAFLEDILASGLRAATIVDDMLNFSRRSDDSKAMVNISGLIDKTLALCSHDYNLKKKYDFRKIEISRKFQENTPEVYCSPMEIQQVLLNLLSNAAQALKFPEGADKKPQIDLRLSFNEDFVQIEVKDNGPGINNDLSKRIFEPFFTTKPVGVGTGLGLSVSYFIITNRHQGAITVDSEPGQGTCFTIKLPLGGHKGELVS